jgi:hypothetical protein
MPTNGKQPKGQKYDEVGKGAANIVPYSFNNLLFDVGHKDFTKALIESLRGNRDADKLFCSALFRSFWFWVIIVGLSLGMALLAGAIFYHYPKQTSHIVEKTVNSQIPGLLPIPSSE